MISRIILLVIGLISLPVKTESLTNNDFVRLEICDSEKYQAALGLTFYHIYSHWSAIKKGVLIEDSNYKGCSILRLGNDRYQLKGTPKEWEKLFKSHGITVKYLDIKDEIEE